MGKTNDPLRLKQPLMSVLALFSATGTLLCCALPALMVTVGAGATLAGIVAEAPWLVALSRYKTWTFGLSGGLLAVAGALLWQARTAPCPADPQQAKVCARLRRFSVWTYASSVVIWLTGFFFAFLAIHLLN